MKSLILLNADAKTDRSRSALFENLCARWPELNFWFYGAEQDLDDFRTALPAGEKGPAQLWVHVSVFESNEILEAWLGSIDSSWLQETKVLLFSGGGLVDWDDAGMLDRLNRQGIQAAYFMPALPLKADHPGSAEFQRMIASLMADVDLVLRRRLARELLEALMLMQASHSLTTQFEGLCALYAPEQRLSLEALWKHYEQDPDPSGLRALRDRLLAFDRADSDPIGMQTEPLPLALEQKGPQPG